jgi:hypothetical protein
MRADRRQEASGLQYREGEWPHTGRVMPRAAFRDSPARGSLTGSPIASLDSVKPIALATVLVLLGACTRRVEPPPVRAPAPAEKSVTAPAAPIRTDRSHYVLTNGPRGREATIVSTFRAPDAHPVYIVNCNGALSASLQRKVGDEWVYAWTVAMNACLSPPLVVPAGGEQTSSIHLHENAGGVPYPRGAKMIESGTYRVIWTGVLTSFDADERGFGPELPLEQRISEPITIEVPPADLSR